jgi:diguanylate cyclase (GGDEF)-like protein
MSKPNSIEVTPPVQPGPYGRLLKSLTLPFIYLSWAVLAGISVWLNIVSLSPVSTGGLIAGIIASNAYFIGLSQQDQHAWQPNDESMPGAQTAIALFWVAIYAYLSSGGRELVLGMYASILMFGLFRVTPSSYRKLLFFAFASYVFSITMQLGSNMSMLTLKAELPSIMALLSVVVAAGVFSVQHHQQVAYSAYRNYELQVILQRLTRIAKRDHLTRSYNRRYIMEALAREKARADRENAEFSVCILDLDHFKQLNDRYGHAVGDKVLLSFAKRIRSELRGMDSVNQSQFERSFGRFGGEEFIAVLPNTDLDGGRGCAERLCKAIASEPFLDKYPVTVSVGIASYYQGETIPELLNRADTALYEAKASGRNKVCCADDPETEKSLMGDTIPDLSCID